MQGELVRLSHKHRYTTICSPFNRCLDSLSACLSGYEEGKLCVTSIDCYYEKGGGEKGTG
jgi:hypothetical protein